MVSAPDLEIIRRTLAATAFDDHRAGRMQAAVALVLAGELCIWGLTYRVLTIFFERLQLQIARPESPARYNRND